ncbi:MAG: hypothetical protein FWC46_05285, partial [Actinomycetia bacterium]|nr:hypothetical protein [Actinomycetes bacterium]
TADGEPEMVVAQPSGSEYAMTGLAADARRVAWCISQRVEPSPEATYHAWIYLQDLASGSLTEVSLDSSPGGGNVLSLSGRWLAWGNGSGWGDSRQFLFDLTSAKIFVVADTPGGSWIRVNDPAVAWYESPPPGAPYPILRVMTGFLREPS